MGIIIAAILIGPAVLVGALIAVFIGFFRGKHKSAFLLISLLSFAVITGCILNTLDSDFGLIGNIGISPFVILAAPLNSLFGLISFVQDPVSATPWLFFNIGISITLLLFWIAFVNLEKLNKQRGSRPFGAA